MEAVPTPARYLSQHANATAYSHIRTGCKPPSETQQELLVFVSV